MLIKHNRLSIPQLWTRRGTICSRQQQTRNNKSVVGAGAVLEEVLIQGGKGKKSVALAEKGEESEELVLGGGLWGDRVEFHKKQNEKMEGEAKEEKVMMIMWWSLFWAAFVYDVTIGWWWWRRWRQIIINGDGVLVQHKMLQF